MSEKKVWLITGAGRGLGVDIAKAALTAGHAVVATGRDATKVAAAVGDHDNLLAIKLDVTRPQDAQAAGIEHESDADHPDDQPHDIVRDHRADRPGEADAQYGAGQHHLQVPAVPVAPVPPDRDHVLRHQDREQDRERLQRRHREREQRGRRHADAGEAALGEPDQQYGEEGDEQEEGVGEHRAGLWG